MKYMLVGTNVFLVQRDRDELYPELVSDSIEKIKTHYLDKFRKEYPDVQSIHVNFGEDNGLYDEMSFKFKHASGSVSYESIFISKVEYI